MSTTNPTANARYTTQLGRAAHSARSGRESLSKRLGKVAKQIAARDGHACVYCGATAASSGAHLHLDHLTPRHHSATDPSWGPGDPAYDALPEPFPGVEGGVFMPGVRGADGAALD